MGLLSNYCGPGGDGQIQHQTDECCRIHDNCYSEDTLNKYLFYNNCDERFLNCLNKARLSSLRERAINTASSAYFKSKEFFTPKKVDWNNTAIRRVEKFSASKNAREKFIDRIRGDKCWRKQLFKKPVNRTYRVFRKSNANNKIWVRKGRGRGRGFGGRFAGRGGRRNMRSRRRGRIRGGVNYGVVVEEK